jgi:hypothetical protein
MGLAIAGDEGALDPVDEQSAVHVRTDALSARVVEGWLLEDGGASRVDDSGYVLAPGERDVMFTWIVDGRAVIRRVPTAVIEHVLRVQGSEG